MFDCTKCGKSFSVKSSLTRHLLSPTACPKQAKVTAEHQQGGDAKSQGAASRRWACKQCGKEYATGASYRNHLSMKRCEPSTIKAKAAEAADLKAQLEEFKKKVAILEAARENQKTTESATGQGDAHPEGTTPPAAMRAGVMQAAGAGAMGNNMGTVGGNMTNTSTTNNNTTNTNTTNNTTNTNVVINIQPFGEKKDYKGDFTRAQVWNAVYKGLVGNKDIAPEAAADTALMLVGRLIFGDSKRPERLNAYLADARNNRVNYYDGKVWKTTTVPEATAKMLEPSVNLLWSHQPLEDVTDTFTQFRESGKVMGAIREQEATWKASPEKTGLTTVLNGNKHRLKDIRAKGVRLPAAPRL